MLVIILITLLAGMVLGPRFKVMVLLPASGVFLLTVVFEHVAFGRWQTPSVAAAGLSSLQMGYMASYGIRRIIIATRLSRRRGPPASPSQLSERERFAPKMPS
jgi:hypothetical protein